MLQAPDAAEADCTVAARCKDMADLNKSLSGLDCKTAPDHTDLATTKMSVCSAYVGACQSDSNSEIVVYVTCHGYAQDAAPQTPPMFQYIRFQKDWAAEAYADVQRDHMASLLFGQLHAKYGQAADFWRDHMATLQFCRRGLGQMHAEYGQAANLQALLQAQGSKQICYLSAYSLGGACVCHMLEVLKSKGWLHRQRSYHQLTHCPYHTSKIPDSEQDPQRKRHKQM